MNKIFFLIATAIISAIPCLSAQEPQPDMNDDSRFKLAVSMYDIGNYDAALQEFDYLVKKDPTNWAYLYERALTLAGMQRYDKAVKDCKAASKKDGCNWQVYQLWGSCLDYLNKPNEAIEVLKKGIGLFPDAQYLYLEAGTTYLGYKYYSDAINWYNRAIEIAPGFQSPYYRGASAYANTDDKVWSLVYAETSILLNPNKLDRFDDMSKLIRSVFEESITADGDSLKIKLCASRGIMVDRDDLDEPDPINKANTLLEFSGVYEACVASALHPEYIARKDSATVLTLSGLADLRRGAVETYYKVSDNLFGNSMYLLEFQKAVIDAGYWDTYNAYILAAAFPDEAEKWICDHMQELNDFIGWYNGAPFFLDKQHTVGKLSISRDERRLTMLEALQMLVDLSDAGKDKTE